MSDPVVRPAMCGALLLVAGLCSVNAAVADVGPSVTDRELLLRKWDLDRDGRIDEGEAEVARSKMRRERAEFQAKTIGAAAAGKREPATATDREPSRTGVNLLPEDVPLPRRRERPADPRPTNRELNAAARSGTGPAGSATQPAGEGPVDRQGRGNSVESGDQPAAGGRGAPVVTGGARAGGLARPGYGSGVPRGDLNAGRPLQPRPAGQRPPLTGGLLPTARRVPVTTPPPAAPPRVTAEDVPY